MKTLPLGKPSSIELIDSDNMLPDKVVPRGGLTGGVGCITLEGQERTGGGKKASKLVSHPDQLPLCLQFDEEEGDV